MRSILNRSLTILLILFGSISAGECSDGCNPRKPPGIIPAPSTWTWVQDSPVIFCGQYGSISSCTIGAAQIAPTQPGSVWVIQVMTPNNVTITSVDWRRRYVGQVSETAMSSIRPGFSVDAWYKFDWQRGEHSKA